MKTTADSLRLVYRYLEGRRDAMQALLRELVVLESPSHDLPALERMARRLLPEWRSRGTRVTLRQPRQAGPILRAELDPGRGRIRGQLLILGHLDTVYEMGTLQHMPFRLQGGRWWEIDDPQLLAFKEERLPAGTAPNPLIRVPVSFETDTLAPHLAPLAGDDRALVVLEGVTMYLSDDALGELASTVRTVLPRATLVCDLMSPAFGRTFSRSLRRELTRLGARFGSRRRHPRHLIEGAGYVARERHSIPGRAREAGTLPIPGWIFHTLLRGLRDGYAVWVFEPAG